VHQSLSTPSLGITDYDILKAGWQLGVKLSTPSLGITNDVYEAVIEKQEKSFQLPLSGSLPDYYYWPLLRQYYTFNSLSRDHKIKKEKCGYQLLLIILSTPSLGIT